MSYKNQNNPFSNSKPINLLPGQAHPAEIARLEGSVHTNPNWMARVNPSDFGDGPPDMGVPATVITPRSPEDPSGTEGILPTVGAEKGAFNSRTAHDLGVIAGTGALDQPTDGTKRIPLGV